MEKIKSYLWRRIANHAKKMQNIHLRDLFSQDPERFQKLSFVFEQNLFDFSKNFISNQTLELFIELARVCELDEQIQDLFLGKNHYVPQPQGLHTALRSKKGEQIYLQGEEISTEIEKELNHMKRFVNAVLQGQWRGFTDKPFTDIVNIGIGGSHLGASLLTEALTDYKTHLKIHFVSNGDGIHAYNLTKVLDPETTLFIIVSKTFTTKETLINAKLLIQWFYDMTGASPFGQHVIGVSADVKKMKSFGIPKKNQFVFWDFIGGRFSIWSSVGLAAALSIGFDNFNSFLAGGNSVDQHFYQNDLNKNLAFIMAILDIFYIQFWNAQSRAILPYHSYLKQLPAYLQQMSMESLGKSVDRKGQRTDYLTGNIIWGELGSNGQHAFYQLFHQGTMFIPVDFIISMQLEHGQKEFRNFIIANALAQAKALMHGQTKEEFCKKVKTREPFMKIDIAQRTSPGNRPSTIILLAELSPRTMGQLVALYEHKIFVQSVIWNINAFDQWGVELGKQLAENYLFEFKNSSSTEDELLNYIKKFYNANDPSFILEPRIKKG